MASTIISAMPTNLYGPGDNFDLDPSHVVPALMRKAHEAKRAGGKTLEVWGSGTPMREFLHVDDAADALVFLLKNYSGDSHVNVGSGKDITIAELAGDGRIRRRRRRRRSHSIRPSRMARRAS